MQQAHGGKFYRSILLVATLLLIFGGLVGSGRLGVSWSTVGKFLRVPDFGTSSLVIGGTENVKIVSEESVVTDTVEKVSPAVVTVGVTRTTRNLGTIFDFDPFNPLGPFQQRERTPQDVEQDIGSGFIVGSDGLIVTNKHVVSDTQSKYRIITKDDKSYDVVKIYRDPTNDLAILKINPLAGEPVLPTVELGDSSKIKVGQLAIAIGTALGEFRNTVTTGVISGVGRGITAGSPFEGYAERLDNVIQTDAAINPGNSGGPLLNSSGQVIGVNIAVSGEGQNIGFALPINVIKEALTNFNQTGQFNRPYLGVRYKTVSKDIAILNDVPEGVYILDVIAGSPAQDADVAIGDIITKIDGMRLAGEDAELAKVIAQKKVGDRVTLTVYRDTKEIALTVTLGNQSDTQE